MCQSPIPDVHQVLLLFLSTDRTKPQLWNTSLSLILLKIRTKCSGGSSINGCRITTTEKLIASFIIIIPYDTTYICTDLVAQENGVFAGHATFFL